MGASDLEFQSRRSRMRSSRLGGVPTELPPAGASGGQLPLTFEPRSRRRLELAPGIVRATRTERKATWRQSRRRGLVLERSDRTARGLLAAAELGRARHLSAPGGDARPAGSAHASDVPITSIHVADARSTTPSDISP